MLVGMDVDETKPAGTTSVSISASDIPAHETEADETSASGAQALAVEVAVAQPSAGEERRSVTDDAADQKECVSGEQAERVGTDKVCTVSSSGGLFMPGKIGGRELCFLLDTGCTKSILSKAFFDRLPGPVRDQLRISERAAELADGSGLHVYGSLRVTGRLRSISFEEEFLVCSITDDAILGISFLREHECTLEFSKSVLTVGKLELPCVDRYGRQLVTKIQVYRTVHVAPGKECNITGRVDTNNGSPFGLVEEYPKGPAVAVAASLGKPDAKGRLPVRCYNPGPQPIVLNAGTVIGWYQEVELVEQCTSDTDTIRQVQHTQAEGTPSVPSHVSALYEQALTACNSQADRQALADLLCRYASVFSTGEADVGLTDLVHHKIPLRPDTTPIRQPPRRLGPEKDQIVEQEVKKLLEQGMIEPADSEWSSPVVLVKKKDGTWRLCVDYRKLNAVTRKDAYPIPRIDDSLDTLAGSRYFSTLDMLSGYWQVPMDEQAQERSAFVTRSGLWR